MERRAIFLEMIHSMHQLLHHFMSTLTIAKARTGLGGLIDKAFAGEEIFIVRPRGKTGRAIVQLVPVAEPDPIPHYPPGALVMNRARIAAMDTLPDEADPFAQ
jgi:antitoxin (DNA-binding transcriptional repressor) of toxin-antitoxin stability system